MWNCDVWFASIDLKKAFDRVEHSALFRASEDQGVPPEYIQLLFSLYKNQAGCGSGSVKFRITRGVRQGDILSPLLFNAALEFALRSWKSRLENAGINLGQQERLMNIRYADDLMLYSTSSCACWSPCYFLRKKSVCS